MTVAQSATGTRSIKMTYTSTTTETAPSTDASVGLDLHGLKTIDVHLESADTNTFHASSLLLAYLWNPHGGTAGLWNRAPDLDLTVGTPATGAVTGIGFRGINVESSGARIAYYPYNLGHAGTIYINGYAG